MSKRIRPAGITQERIATADLDATITGKAVLLWDVSPRGFFARIGPPNSKFPTGKITFGVHKRQGGRGSRAICVMFGVYPEMSIQEARDKAISLLAAIRNGQNPSLEKKSLFSQRRQEYQQFKTSKFSLVYEAYRQAKLAEKGANSSYFTKGIVNNFNRYVLPQIGNSPLKEITRDDLKSLLDAIPTLPTRRVVHAQLAPIFKYALLEQIITTNPFDTIKLPAASAPRDRVLSRDEIKALWLSLDHMQQAPKPIFAYICRALLFSAARLNEIARLEFSEINYQDNLIVIPAKRMKGKKPFVIPMTPALKSTIEATPKKNLKWVYTYGKKPMSSFSNAKIILDKAMEKRLGRKMSGSDCERSSQLEPWVLHSLRHTFSTVMASRGHNLDHIELCLAHSILKGAQKSYNHYAFLKEKRVVLEDWSNYIQECLGSSLLYSS